MKIEWMNKPLPAALLLVFLWTGVRLAVLSRTGIPAPAVHDEFSYLLGADTFAHGRLANPPPKLGKFFESPNILVRPVYAPKYPPGQALFLALGQKVFGLPFYGVLIGNVLMLFTTCVMLYSWVSPRWALAVSAMIALCLWPGTYWASSYWGGSVAASGGAMVLLAIGIYRNKQSPLAAAIFAIGVLLLFFTRPYEGGVFTLTVLLVFAKEIWHKPPATVLVLALSILAAGGVWTCYYDRAITGNPFRLPYMEHDRQYNVAPVFWFLPLRPQPVYSHPRLAAEHGTNGEEALFYEGKGEARYHRFVLHYQGNEPWWAHLWRGLLGSWWMTKSSIGLVILPPLLVPLAWQEPLFRKLAIVTGVFVLALSVETFHMQHYWAPVWGAVALMIAVWAERAWSWQLFGLPLGKMAVLLALASPVIAVVLRTEMVPHRFFGMSPVQNDWPKRRVALIERLSKVNGRHLIFVRYPSPNWFDPEEWVYNGADIDQQRIVFAHDLGREENRELLHYYPDRTAWLLTIDPDIATGHEHIEPYPSAWQQ